MKIHALRSWQETIPFTQPFAVAYASRNEATLHFLEIRTDGGLLGRGSASPSVHVTGETTDTCAAALDESELGWLLGEDVRHAHSLIRRLLPVRCTQTGRTLLSATPAACAAVDMALHDLLTQVLDVPLVDFLGRCHTALPTSITIGLKPIPEVLSEAQGCLAKGYRALKVKLGYDVEEDIEKLHKLWEILPAETLIRVDPNQSYSAEQTRHFFEQTRGLALELIEQPMPADAIGEMRGMPLELRETLCADESLHSPEDAVRLLTPEPAYGLFNIKLMKCGGIDGGLRIARMAEVAQIPLMWGCMVESRVSLAAALHAAYASPNTRFLDLDGDTDLVRDPAAGGFVLENGNLRLLDRPGLGVEWS